MIKPQHTPVSSLLNRLGLALGLSLAVVACGNGEADSSNTEPASTGAESASERPQIESPEGAPEIALGDMAMGPADAPVTVIEYASLTCHHCASFHESTFKRLKPAYIDTGKIRFILRDFPLDRLAYEATVLARCAGEDQYFDVVDHLFENQENWLPRTNGAGEISRVRGLFQDYGEDFGVSKEAYEACMANKALEDRLLARIEEGRNRYDVSATPTIVINGEKYEGARAFTAISKHINGLLPNP
ncbi:MAG: DsbA family protein [Alphaproteobacteria bacterium]